MERLKEVKKFLRPSQSESSRGPTQSHLSHLLLLLSLTMLIQWCCLLLLTPILFRVQALSCDEVTQYRWPRSNPTMCCNKCPPGEYLKTRCEKNQQTRCEPCGEGYYMDSYNFEMTCRLCTDCAKENMKYNQFCTAERDAECVCYSSTRQRQCVDLSESVLCVCVHSAYLFHSHQQTHTCMWMGLVFINCLLFLDCREELSGIQPVHGGGGGANAGPGGVRRKDGVAGRSLREMDGIQADRFRSAVEWGDIMSVYQSLDMPLCFKQMHTAKVGVESS
ncbi:hypothetical protein MHYP_G00023260 [Metynnis hypsauchen]